MGDDGIKIKCMQGYTLPKTKIQRLKIFDVRK